MPMRRILRGLGRLSLLSLLTLFFDAAEVRPSAIPLNEEEVFCLYYGMAGGEFYVQDLEDLSETLGQPTFTFFKPSEMFTGNTLLKLRNRLRVKIEKLDATSLFKWTRPLQVLKRDGMISIPRLDDEHQDLPHPTPFIRSRLSGGSAQSINRNLKSMVLGLLADNPVLEKEIPLSIHIYLKPDRIDREFHRRTVAEEDILLPHRYVVLRPVRLEISSSDNPTWFVTAKDIHLR